jgi:hypothetical protein
MPCFEVPKEFADDSTGEEWQLCAYDQFLRDDSEEDAVYEALGQPAWRDAITPMRNNP